MGSDLDKADLIDTGNEAIGSTGDNIGDEDIRVKMNRDKTNTLGRALECMRRITNSSDIEDALDHSRMRL